MDQGDTMDFKALMAKFQDEKLLKQHKIKPALMEKPKVVSPPQSPTHYLPAGARPSLLTSINQTWGGKTAAAPRVVFKEEKKEGKKLLIQTNLKGEDKSEGKLKGGKDEAAKGSKEKLGDSSDQKQKKENRKDRKISLVLPRAQKEITAELVPATPPPKLTTQKKKKKGLLGFKKSLKTDSVEVPADPILDTPSTDVPGPAPLIPVTSDFGNATRKPEISAPSLLQSISTLPDSSAAVEITPPILTIPESSDFAPPAVIIPDIPAPEVPTPQSETSLEVENPALPVFRPTSKNEIIPDPPITAPPPPPEASAPSPSPPEAEIVTAADIEAVIIAVVEKPPAPAEDPPSAPPSPKAERPISAFSALSRAEDMSPGKRTLSADPRIMGALEKARKKSTSPLINPTRSYSITPPPEEIPPPQSPPWALPQLPPTDYEARAGNALPSKPPQVNGIDHRQASPMLEGITEEESDALPELLVVPPPPSRKTLPDLESLGSSPEKPDRPPSVNLSKFIPLPPPVEDNEIPAPHDFSETDTTDVPEFEDVVSDAHSSVLPASEWGTEEDTGPEVPDGQNLTEFYSTRITVPGTEIRAQPVFGDEYRDDPPPESSLPASADPPPMAEPQAEEDNGVYESTENVYEDVSVSASKKKGKTDGGKKRKGAPKNPYAEAAPETIKEKSKTSRFSKNDKKAAADGPDEKELKKKEKQRLEKEKKELKEKQEREKKDQKEREKKENELKKKFNLTGQEDAMYRATVTVTTKGRKNDLPVKSGDDISIIRTTDCPKGKWLARDGSNNYGYIAVDHVELDIHEMLEISKKATRKPNSNAMEAEVTSIGSRTSNHYPLSAESYDSEEWTIDDDDEHLSPSSGTVDPFAQMGHTRTLSEPDMGNQDLSINHQHSHSDISANGSHIQARHEALQKLATFFHSPKPVESTASITEPETTPVLEEEEAVHAPEASPTQEINVDPNLLILPPPDLYADLTVE